MRIRPYRSQDAGALARIYREAALHTGAQAYSAEETRAWADAARNVATFGRRLTSGLTLVAESDDGAAVAFGQLEPDDRISLLYTAPGFVRASYASGIYRMLEDHARRSHVAVLHADVSRVARPFFEKQGFELVETEHVRRGGVSIERLRMEKRLERPAYA